MRRYYTFHVLIYFLLFGDVTHTLSIQHDTLSTNIVIENRFFFLISIGKELIVPQFVEVVYVDNRHTIIFI